MDRPEIVLSEDGSPTLKSNRFGVTYHSIYGAIDESITVFLSAGLQYQLLRGEKKISIFEMGFGTGLNAYLTFLESKKHLQQSFTYTAVEKYPIDHTIAANLNYPMILQQSVDAHLFMKMHTDQASDSHQKLSPNFALRTIIGDISTVVLPDSRFNVVYYDAFAPTAQEELWTPDVMSKLYDSMSDGGVLVTYCAKGSFKRALKSVGFNVEALPGPPGKREMTRAFK